MYFMYIMGIFQLTWYRLGNIFCVPLGTLVIWMGCCRHHTRLVSAGEIQWRWTSHGTAPPTSCPRLGLGAATAHIELEVGRLSQTIGHRSPPCLPAPRAGQTSPSGKNLPLKTSPTLCCIYWIIIHPCFLRR